MGHPDLAMLLYIEALAAMRRTLGDEDPGALINLITNRASLYKETNQYALALPLCEEAVARRRRVLGNANVDTLISMNSMSNLYDDMGRHDPAVPRCNEVLAARRRILGNAHPQTLDSINNMAVLHENMGEHVAAATLVRESPRLIGWRPCGPAGRLAVVCVFCFEHQLWYRLKRRVSRFSIICACELR
jgi:hypothetical protein